MLRGTMYSSAGRPRQPADKAKPPRLLRAVKAAAPRKEVLLVYTEYGYTVNGIEYSTIDEALEAQRTDDDD